MEVNKSFNLLKNSILALEKNQSYVFSNITGVTSASRSKALSAINELQPYFTGSSSELRSLHLLLLVNTELGIRRDLENDQEVGHVVGFLPTLSPYFYLLCVVRYNLLDFMQETVIDASLPLVLELINVVSKRSKHLSPFESCQIYEKLLIGITTRIKFSECDYTNRKLFDEFKAVMLYFKFEPKSEDEKVDDETLQVIGFKILSLLRIIRKLLKLSFDLVDPPEMNDIYHMTCKVDVTSWYKSFDLMDKDEVLLESLGVVFFKCRIFLYELDVQMYMAWHEKAHEGKTLQTVIGEESYYVTQFLKLNENSKHLPAGILELVQLLSGIVCEPKVKQELNLSEKLGAERLEELFFDKEIDSKLLSSLKHFLNDESNKFEFVVTIKLIHKLCTEKRLHETALDEVKELVLMLLSKSKLNEIVFFSADFLAEYGLQNILFLPSVNLTEVIKDLNQCYEEEEAKNEEVTVKKKNETLKTGLLLGLRSPELVLSTLIEQSILEINHINGLLEMLKILRSVCLYVRPNDEENPHPLLITTMERFLRANCSKFSPSEKQLLTELVIFLGKSGLMDCDLFLSRCLLPLLNVKDEINWEMIADLLKLYKEFYTTCVNESKLATVMILAQLAQLLEQCRWSIETFTPERLAACEEILNLRDIFLNVYIGNPAPEKDKHWLSMQLSRFSYLTKSYFPYIYKDDESKDVDKLFLSLIHGASDVHSEFVRRNESDPTALMMPISKVIINLTPKELQSIVFNYSINDREKVFYLLIVLSDAVTFICGAATQFSALLSGDSNSIFKCLGHVINNYLSVLQVTIIEGPASDDYLNYIKCVNRIALTLKCFPESLLRTYQFNVLKIINEILPKLNENSSDLDGDTRQLLLGLMLF